MVCEISDREDSWRSIVDVHWDNGNVNRYRLGIEGKVDVQGVEVVIGGQFYFEHLPDICKF